jgi:hypothetical protein
MDLTGKCMANKQNTIILGTNSRFLIYFYIF